MFSSGKKAPPKQKTKEEIENEEKVKKQQKIDRYTKVLKKFQESSNRAHRFSSKLSCFDKMLIRDITSSLGLYHYDEGLLDNRHIVVAKEPKKEKVASKEEEPSLEDDSDLDQEQFDNRYPSENGTMSKACQNEKKNKKSNGVSASAPAAESVSTKHCTLCGKNILTANFTTHRPGCERREREAIALQKKKKQEAKRIEAERQAAEERVRASKRKKEKSSQKGVTASASEESRAKTVPKGSKSKAKKGKASAVSDDEDFDAVLSEFSDKSNKLCGLKGCKNGGGSLMLQTCCLCRTAFCLAHSMAEAHGCSQHAKADARATVLREGALYPGSGVPSKLLSQDRRAYLQKKLDSKLAAKEQARKKQTKK